VSSSGHLALIPALLGWEYADLEPELRKSFEVALHAGSAVALAISLRSQRVDPLETLLTTSPPAAIGFALERPIERRLGGPRSVAVAQVIAGALLLAADRRPAERSRPCPRDFLAVGLGQVAALAPGVSRAGAALTAARLRRLERPAAAALARRSALPITAGAALLKGVRLARSGLPRELRAPFAAGAGAALVTGLAAAGAARRLDRSGSFAPLATYRMILGAGALGLLAQRRDRT
jgi:undecaprenyl-diphosphatase